MSAREAMSEDDAAKASTKWVRELMRRCKIEVVEWPDGSTGLLNVPAKYVAAIDALHQALWLAMVGDPLPEFTEPEARPVKPRQWKRRAQREKGE